MFNESAQTLAACLITFGGELFLQVIANANFGKIAKVRFARNRGQSPEAQRTHCHTSILALTLFALCRTQSGPDSDDCYNLIREM